MQSDVLLVLLALMRNPCSQRVAAKTNTGKVKGSAKGGEKSDKSLVEKRGQIGFVCGSRGLGLSMHA